MCAGFFLLHSKCYRPDGYLICMTLCAILNLDEMKSVPMRLLHWPMWADTEREGAYGSLNLLPLL